MSDDLTPSQRKTLDYVREHGRVMADAIGTGYSIRSARALERKGLLEVVEEPREIKHKSGRVERYQARFYVIAPEPPEPTPSGPRGITKHPAVEEVETGDWGGDSRYFVHLRPGYRFRESESRSRGFDSVRAFRDATIEETAG